MNTSQREPKFTIRIQNIKTGRVECVGEFDTRAEAGVTMLDYPEDDELLYRVVEIGTEDADC